MCFTLKILTHFFTLNIFISHFVTKRNNTKVFLALQPCAVLTENPVMCKEEN